MTSCTCPIFLPLRFHASRSQCRRNGIWKVFPGVSELSYSAPHLRDQKMDVPLQVGGTSHWRKLRTLPTLR